MIQEKMIAMNAIERQIINSLQGGFPVCERPFATVAAELGMDEQTVIDTIDHLLESGKLSRFGPLYHAERLGGGLSLAAMSIPNEAFERVNELVNALPEVAHNYQRDHELNMWFVIATETPEEIDQVITRIEQLSGLPVYNMPKLHEFFVGLKLDV